MEAEQNRGLKYLLPQITGAAIATSHHISVGLLFAYSAVLIPQLEDDRSDIKVTKSDISWIASILLLVSPLASIVTVVLMDKYGRIITLKLSIIPGMVGWLLIACAKNVPMLIMGRIVGGFASIMFQSPGAVYVAEITEKSVRGSLSSLVALYVSLGMLLMYIKGWILGWRTIAWLNQIYLLATFILLFFIPESPDWLIYKNRLSEGQKALEWFYKNHTHQDEDHTNAEHLFEELVEKIEGNKKKVIKSKLGKLKEFLKPTGYKPLFIICGVFALQQFSGIYVVLFYAVTFFESVGTSLNPYAASIFIGFMRLLTSIFNIYILKRVNKKHLFMVSGFGMGVSLLISGFFTNWIKAGTTTLTWVPGTLVLCYAIFSMCGLLPIPWIMTAELFPLKIRSLAHTIVTSLANIIMFFAVQNYTNMRIFFGGAAGLQWFFGGVSFVSVVYCYLFLPETHNKKLSEIEEYFENNDNKRNSNTNLKKNSNGLRKEDESEDKC